MFTDAEEIDPEELKALRSQAAALLRRYRKLNHEAREARKIRSQEEVAEKLGITRWDVREDERRGLIKARRAVLRILTEPQP